MIRVKKQGIVQSVVITPVADHLRAAVCEPLHVRRDLSYVTLTVRLELERGKIDGESSNDREGSTEIRANELRTIFQKRAERKTAHDSGSREDRHDVPQHPRLHGTHDRNWEH